MEAKIFSLILLVTLVYGQDSTESDSSNASSSEEDIYVYPCDTQDMDCMRQYFSKSLLCTNSSHDDGSPIQEDRLAAYIPRINMTILANGTVVTFYGSQITRFREDRSSYNLVITIKYDSINIKSETANYVINQQERESLVVTDSFNLTYSGELSGTVIQGGWTYILFVEVNTDVLTDSSIEVGSSISNSSNEVISQTYEELEADLPTAMTELLFTIAPYSFYVYFQKYICDYSYEHWSGNPALDVVLLSIFTWTEIRERKLYHLTCHIPTVSEKYIL